MSYTIYHNPKCGTSRNTLATLKACGIEPEVILYLETPPTRETLVELLKANGQGVRPVLRQKGSPYEELNLDNPELTDDQLIDFMMEHPILINRPLVVSPQGTKLCRPSTEVLNLIPESEYKHFVNEQDEVVINEQGKRVL